MGDIWLAGRFEVRPQGHAALPLPPTRVCGVLLVLLAERYPDWVSRREIGNLLHHESPTSKRATAVRQTIARLRAWLPDHSVELESDRLRLAHPWRLLIGGASGLAIAPGLEHPWMDEFRLRRSGALEAPVASPERLLFDAISAVAENDPDTARKLFCSAPELVMLLPQRDFAWLAGATRPLTRGAPDACSYDLLLASASYMTTRLEEALRLNLRAYRLANKRHDHPNIARASAQVMFTFLESGQMDLAAEWLERLTKADRDQSMRLLVLNAKSMYFWNSNLVHEALATLRSAADYVGPARRVTQLHYFTNLTVLEAEAGDVEASIVTIQRARELFVGRSDRVFEWNLALAESEGLSRSGQHDVAESILTKAIQDSSHPETLLSSWYLRETQAEVACRAGMSARAQSLWRSVESDRVAAGFQLTPRLQARKHRIFP